METGKIVAGFLEPRIILKNGITTLNFLYVKGLERSIYG
jgi:hypothetical protein